MSPRRIANLIHFETKAQAMNSIIYLIGLVVVVLFILSFLGFA